MGLENIVAQLKSERDRISQVIGLLEGNTPPKTRSRPAPGFRCRQIDDRSAEVVSPLPVAGDYRKR